MSAPQFVPLSCGRVQHRSPGRCRGVGYAVTTAGITFNRVQRATTSAEHDGRHCRPRPARRSSRRERPGMDEPSRSRYLVPRDRALPTRRRTHLPHCTLDLNGRGLTRRAAHWPTSRRHHRSGDAHLACSARTTSPAAATCGRPHPRAATRWPRSPPPRPGPARCRRRDGSATFARTICNNARVVVCGPGTGLHPARRGGRGGVPLDTAAGPGHIAARLLDYAEQLCRPVPALATDLQAEPEAAYSRITETFNATLAPVTDDTAAASRRLLRPRQVDAIGSSMRRRTGF